LSLGRFEHRSDCSLLALLDVALVTAPPRAAVPADLEKARTVRTANAQHRADDLAPTIQELQSSGCASLRSIAAGLNSREIAAPRGGDWSAAQVRSVLSRIG
jgi:Recombinase-like helix-turn-helix domain